jgi:hypothetical protein
MSEKTLQIKRIFAYTIYNNIKNTPPKEFPTTGEIKSTISVVLPALKEHISAYIALVDRAVSIQEKGQSKEVSEEEVKTVVDTINNDWKEYNKTSGIELVDINLDAEGLKTLKEQFERENWGKNWITNIEEFGELMEAFAEASK